MATPDLLPKVPWWVKALVTAALAIGGTMYADRRDSKFNLDAQSQQTIVNRITSLEGVQAELKAKQQDDHDHLTYIQNRVDQILDKLTSWEKK